MKTEIDNLEVEQVNNHYAVTCAIYSEDGSILAEVNGLKVTKGELLEYVIDNNMNIMDVFNAAHNDFTQLPQSPINYLSENLNEVVEAYMLEQFQKGVAA